MMRMNITNNNSDNNNDVFEEDAADYDFGNGHWPIL